MIQEINENNPVHILTLEDPIEFLHHDKRGTVTQREVGTDCHSLDDGFYAGLRQDPDVIMIGELRDFKMIQLAMTAAESGHLVLSTLHTNDARSTIDRILEVFPPESQNQARTQLSSSLLGIVAQQLLVRSSGEGRVAACEILINSPTIANLILKEEFDKINDAIANSNSYYQMQTMNQALERLVRSGVVSTEEAMKSASSADDLKLSLSGMVREEGYQVAASSSLIGEMSRPHKSSNRLNACARYFFRRRNGLLRLEPALPNPQISLDLLEDERRTNPAQLACPVAGRKPLGPRTASVLLAADPSV